MTPLQISLGLLAPSLVLGLLSACSGTQGEFSGPLCAGTAPITLTFNDRTDRQEGISAGCRRTHPDGTIDEVWVITGPKSTSAVAGVDQQTLGTLLGSVFAAGIEAAGP